MSEGVDREQLDGERMDWESGPVPRPTWKGRLAALLLLCVLPLGLRAASLDHGLPRGYVPDAHIVRNALGMARDKNPVPRAGQYSTYPNLLPYMLLPVYGGYYFVGKSQGLWEGAQDFGDHVLTRPETVHYLARCLVALFGALTPWVVFRVARAAGLRSGAWIAGWLVATSLLNVHLSTHERPWVPMTFFMALSFWPAVLYARGGRLRHLVLSGVCAGLALATHQGGLLALGVPGLAWLLGPLAWRGPGLRKRLVQGVLCVAAFLVVGVLVGHPYLLVHGRARAEELAGGVESSEKAHLSLGGQPVRLGLSMTTLRHLSRAFVGYDPLLLVLGLAGWALAFRRRALRVPLLWATAWGVFFMTHDNDHVRYLLPFAMGLALPAGAALEAFGAARFGRGAGGRALLLLVLAFPLVQSVRFVQLSGRADTRVEAEDRLYRLPVGSVVAIDRYGPEVELSLDALDRLDRIRKLQGSELYSRERKRHTLLSSGLLDPERYGLDAIPVADVCTFDGAPEVREGLRGLGTDPGAVLASLGATHLLLVEQDLGRAIVEHPLAPLAGGEPTWSIGPAAEGVAVQAPLPLELDFALATLWRTDRPGPRLTLVPLP